MEASWYPDPSGRFTHRYFDGANWTGHVSGPGGTGFDPVGGPQSSPPAPQYPAYPPQQPGPGPQAGYPGQYYSPAYPSNWGYGPGPRPYGAPAVAAKNPAVSLLISFFIPGVGSIVNGETGKGIAILLLYIVSLVLIAFLIGIILAPAVWIWGMVDAYTGAQRWNARHGIIS